MASLCCDEEEKSNDILDTSNIRKTLYCIRHAQSAYNAAVRDPKTWFSTDFWWNKFDPRIRDPLLSELGVSQTDAVSKDLDSCDFISSFGIQLILTSPLRRAMNTMFGVLRNQMDIIQHNHIPIMAHPELREWVDTLGDCGTTKSDLQQKYNTEQRHNIDFSCIESEEWWTSETKQNEDGSGEIVVHESKQNVLDRISAFKHWILEREEDTILVVGHSRWFREFVGAYSKLNNCQMMKVEMIGTEVTEWECMDFEKIRENKEKVKQMAKIVTEQHD